MLIVLSIIASIIIFSLLLERMFGPVMSLMDYYLNENPDLFVNSPKHIADKEVINE